MNPSAHVLLYTDGAEGNGVAEYNHAVLCALAQRGGRVSCVQTRKDNPLIRRQAAAGVRHLWLDFDTDQDFRRSLTKAADAHRIFQEHRPDLVLFSNGCPLSHLAAKQAALDLGVPFVIVEGFAALYLAQRFASLIGDLARQYTAARAGVAVSHENLRLLHQRFGLPADKGTVIYYGRPERFFRPADPAVRRRLRAEWGIPTDAVLCLTAARLDPIKGYPYQLEAIRRLRATPLWPRLWFAWAGTGLLAESLPEALRQLGAAEQVKLLGQRWDVADWLDAADIYAQPSEAEGMPLAVMEAMAKGLPVLATAVGGIPEELGDTGRLLPPPTDPAATAQALADAITAWAGDPDGRRAAGAAGRQRAQALFREERMLAETLGVIDRALRPEPRGQTRAAPLGPPVVNPAPRPAGAGAPRRNGEPAPGLPTEAAASEPRALPLAPASAEWHCRQGQLLAGQGKRAEAAASFREALRLQPDQADAHSGLGVALAEQGCVDEALGHLRQAVRLRPAHAPAHHNLGVALAQLGRLDDAVQSLRAALRLQPAYAEAHANLGNVLARQGQRDAALTHYQEALRLRPDYADVYNNLGLALQELKRPGEAAVYLRQAVRLRPGFAEAHNNLGLALADQGRFAEAEACYHEALHLNPRYTESHVNLGSTYKEQGRPAEAAACYQIALWLQPDSVTAHWNRSLAWLQAGDFARGWQEYEWRWRRPQTPPRPFRQPRWDGSPLAGRTILLRMEQGLGDMIQFIRYAAPLKRQGATVLVETLKLLVPFFRRCPGVAQVFAEGDALPDFDVHAPLMSLPGLLGTTLETVPAEVPYLFADDELVGKSAQALGSETGFKVGVVWQGNPHHGWDHFRSFPLAQLAPLAAVPGVRLYSLQRGPGAEQLQTLKGHFAITDLAGQWADPFVSLRELAAVMVNLDLVVTADTAPAHLAGALGVPVWVALAAVSDWRWLLGRDDSPWYPTLRLFRQRQLDEWGPVFERMAAEIRNNVMQPHTLVKGVRTGVETSQVQSVLDGDIDDFTQTYLRQKAERVHKK